MKKDYHKIKMECKRRHTKVIKKLREIVYKVTGISKKDALNLITGRFSKSL